VGEVVGMLLESDNAFVG